ncbi:MAG: SCO family protein [Alphaproteobacteria bacterium]|nr:SCO family protein [Alphaproteobacteria bacterium]
MHRILVAILAVLLLAITSFTLWLTEGPPPLETTRLAPPLTEAQPPANSSGEQTASPSAAGEAPEVGGPFALTDQHGREVKDTDFRGRVMLVFFGYTHCPDVCPTTLTLLSNIMNQLGKDAAQVAPVFITVDPRRDTPPRLAEFLKNFHPGITGLTGSPEAIEQVENAYKIYHSELGSGASKEASASGGEEDYAVDHSALIYLMGKNGNYLASFSSDTPETQILDAVRQHLY